jgi:hypothetical protein
MHAARVGIRQTGSELENRLLVLLQVLDKGIYCRLQER